VPAANPAVLPFTVIWSAWTVSFRVASVTLAPPFGHHCHWSVRVYPHEPLVVLQLTVIVSVKLLLLPSVFEQPLDSGWPFPQLLLEIDVKFSFTGTTPTELPPESTTWNVICLAMGRPCAQLPNDLRLSRV
jgi:hypothetical protein